jgi:peroxiredoxin Q/BCP
MPSTITAVSLASLVTSVPLALALSTGACKEPTPVLGPPPTIASAGAAAAPAAPGAVAVDAVPPDFAATASDGTQIQLSKLYGKPVVVYFYPKDETPGCTAEACSFRDAWSALRAKGVVLIGVSADTDESHKAFAKNHNLPFLLVSDPNGAIAAQFGVPMDAGFIARESFVIGANGRIKKIYRTVDVTAHAAQIMADLQ